MDPHQRALVEAARNLDIGYDDVSSEWGCDAVIYHHGNQRALIRKGRIYPGLSSNSEFICDQKHVAKAMFRNMGLPTPRSMCIDGRSIRRAHIEEFLESVSKVVVKPADGTHGHGVLIDAGSADAVIAHCDSLARVYHGFLLEEFVSGQDLRIQVVGGELFAACVREPAFIVGDGSQTVEALAHAHDQLAQSRNPANRLLVDEQVLSCLEVAGLQLSDVPARGQKVTLKTVVNLSQGGVATDVTDKVHYQYHRWCAAISAALKLEIFAIDVMTEDITTAHGQILELNARPEWLHHTFSANRQHDVARAILLTLLPDAERC